MTAARRWRLATFAVVGLETLLMIGLLIMVAGSGQLSSGEALSRSLGWAILAIYGLPYLIFVVPALVLAVLNRWPLLAFILSLLPAPALYLASQFD